MVESCVSSVGVDVETASASLLTHVAGIGEALADSPICLLGGHGVVCASTSLERCIGLLEAAEGLAKTIWLAK